MQIFGYVFLFIFLTGCSLAYKDKQYEVEKITEGPEDIIDVKNNNGTTVAVIEVFQDDEYQLVKPEADDDNVCYVLRFTLREQNTTTCYDRVPMQQSEADQIDVTRCEGRDIIFLFPTDCKKDDVKKKEFVRQKRHCFTKEELKSVCIREERYCSRKGWLFRRCKGYSTRCVKYDARVVRTTYGCK